MQFSFSKLLSLILVLILGFSAGCNRNYKRHPGRKAKALEQAKSKKEVEAKDKTDDSFKVGKKDPNSLQHPGNDCQSNDSNSSQGTQAAGTNSETSNVKDTDLPQDKNSIKTDKGLQFKTDQAEISIARSALDKEFLLQGALIPQDLVAMGRSIKSRVVVFQLKGKSIVMLEAAQGHSLNKDFSQRLVLATFPILKQDNDYVTFDFNVGMAKLVTLRDWYANDFEGSDYSSEKQFAAFQVANSYIESAEINDSNQLVIRQISLMTHNENTPDLSSVSVPIEIKYYLSPYRPSKNYDPVEEKAELKKNFKK